MLPNPAEWAAEALIRFRTEGRPTREWPQYRDRYIAQMTQLLADRHMEVTRAQWATRTA
jgi:hypothetical protein